MKSSGPQESEVRLELPIKVAASSSPEVDLLGPFPESTGVGRAELNFNIAHAERQCYTGAPLGSPFWKLPQSRDGVEVMRGLQSEEGHFGEEVKRKVDTFRPSFRELVYFCKIECGTKTSKNTDSPPTRVPTLSSLKFTRKVHELLMKMKMN